MYSLEPRMNEILTILQEECAEVVLTVSKIRRFGYDGTHNGLPPTIERLLAEIGDVLAMIELTAKECEFTEEELNMAKQDKFEKLKLYSDIYIP